MLYHSLSLCLLTAMTAAVPAALQDKRAAPAPLPECYKNKEYPYNSNFDLKTGSIFVDGPAVNTDGALKFPNFNVFNPFLSQIKSQDGDNVAITSVDNASGPNKAQFLPADVSVGRFTMKKMFYGCVSDLGEKAAECTIKLMGQKAQKDDDGHPVFTTRTLNYRPGDLLDGQIKSDLTEADFDGDLFQDVVSITLSIVGTSTDIYIVVDALTYGVCLIE